MPCSLPDVRAASVLSPLVLCGGPPVVQFPPEGVQTAQNLVEVRAELTASVPRGGREWGPLLILLGFKKEEGREKLVTQDTHHTTYM